MVRAMVCATMLAASLTLTGCGGPGPGSSAQNFFEAAGKGDVEKAKKYVAPSDLAGDGSMAMTMIITKVGEMAKQKGGMKSVTVDNETVTGDTAKVKLTITFGDGTSESNDVSMKKVDGGWYIAPDK